MPLASVDWLPASIIGMPMLPPLPAADPPLAPPTPVAPPPAVPGAPSPWGAPWNEQPAPAITIAANTIAATPKRTVAVHRIMANLQEVNVSRNLTVPVIVRRRFDLVARGRKNVSPANAGET